MRLRSVIVWGLLGVLFAGGVLRGRERPYDVRVVAKDPDHDLALLEPLKLESEFSVAPLFASAAALKMGESVFALGSPGGPILAVTLTRGVVSSDGLRKIGDVELVQHDAAINPGNSGGPLLNQDGQVVGINTLKVGDREGLSFAVPVDEIFKFIEANDPARKRSPTPRP